MTVATATAFTISHTTEQEVLAGLELEFDRYRSRIALLSVEACGTLTSMFLPLGPDVAEVIDIQAMETAQLELALAPSVESQEAVILEFVAA